VEASPGARTVAAAVSVCGVNGVSGNNLYIWDDSVRSWLRSDGDLVTVGREPSNDIVLDDPLVSRHHLRLERHRDGWVLVDLDSANGTWIHGDRVLGPVRLHDELIVHIGPLGGGVDLALRLAGGTPVPAAAGGTPLPAAAGGTAMSPQQGPAAQDGRRRMPVYAVVGAVIIAVLGTYVATRFAGTGAGSKGPDDNVSVLAVKSGSPSASPSSTRTKGSGRAHLSKKELRAAKRATVMLVGTPIDTLEGSQTFRGSGTIIDPSGLILTNAHVAAPAAPELPVLYGRPPDMLSDPDYLTVAFSESDDSIGAPAYRARPVAVDGYLDLAVLRIYADAAGNPLTSVPSLPSVRLGDVGGLETGDDLTVVGYPGITDSITVTDGQVSAFLADDRLGSRRAMIDTQARIAGGNSGGVGVDDSGRLIGVPFQSLLERAGDLSYRLRSVNFAVPLIQAAKSGQTYVSPYIVAIAAQETFAFRGWASGPVTTCDVETTSSPPATGDPVAAVFDIRGAEKGTDLVVRFSNGSQPSYFPFRLGSAGSVCFHPTAPAGISGGPLTATLYAGPRLVEVASSDGSP
jgi:putative serine protease PepD